MKKQATYTDFFPELTKTEFRLLAFIAYFGEVNSSLSAATAYRRTFKTTQKKYDEDVSKLAALGYVKNRCIVIREVRLKVLICLHRHYAPMAAQFAVVYPYGKEKESEYLNSVAKLIAKNDFRAVAKLKRPYEGIGYNHFNLFPYVKDLVLTDGRYIGLLQESEVSTMVHEVLWDNFAKDVLTEEMLDFLMSVIPSRLKNKHMLQEEIGAYRFFLTGNKPSFDGEQTVWSRGVAAILTMYRGKLDDALDEFRHALHREGASAAFTQCCLFNYYYGILLYRNCLKHRKSKESLEEYQHFRDSTIIRTYDGNVLIRLLLEHIDIDVVPEKGSILKRMNMVVSRCNTPLYHSWKYLLCKFFEIANDEDSPRLQSSAIIQHELSPYIPIGPDAKAQLQSTFGGAPAISTLRVRASWEVMLSDLSDTLSGTKEVEKRVVYYVIRKELSAIMEQEREPDGTWTDGRLLSQSLMTRAGYDSMDSTDSAIAMELTKKRADQTDIDILVPRLAGTGRLLYGRSYDGRGVAVEIEKEAPYLEFKGQGFTIDITSNVGLDSKGNVKRHTVKTTGTGQYSLVSVNPLQKDIVHRFLSMRHFPSSAATSLKRAIESLKGIIEVKEDIMDSLLQPAVMSQGVLAVQVSPDKNEYLVRIQATAMEDGIERFTPAEGEDIVYDEVEGLTHCVNRDLTREYENKKLLDTFLLEETKAEAKSYTDYKIWWTEGLLKLLAYVHDHQDKFFVEWPDGVRLKFRGDVKSSDIDVAVKSDQEWFAVEGEVKIGDNKLSLKELVAACCSTELEGFVRLSDDEYVRMSEALKKHIQALEALGRGGKGGFKNVPKYQVGALAAMIDGLNAKTDSGYKKFMEKTKAAFETEAAIPDGLMANLRDYQKEGFRWMCRLDAWGAGACLADDMGLGKTVQTIAFMLHKADKGPSLVVAPKSVVPNWVQELARFAPSIRPVVLNNTDKRQGAVSGAGPMDVILCTYGVLGTEAALLQSRQWNVVCLDEAHQIKNRETLASRAAMDLKADSRVILTGTPLQNHLGELWNLFQFINPGLLGTWPVFRDSFILPTLDEEHRMLLKEMTAPFILRRTKEDVLLELPEKLITTHRVELTDEEQKIYEKMRQQAELKFKKHKTKEERKEAAGIDINFFAELMKLRMAACSMKLVYDKWKNQSSKITELLEILTHVMSNPNNNVIVFSQFTSLLSLVKKELTDRDIDFYYLDGQTPLEKREEMVKNFQSGAKQLFLSSLKAGGVGINLTAANYVILLDPWWNPAIESQAMDRAHRIGQKRVVQVIRLISAQTIEEKILQLHETKRKLTNVVLDGTGDSYKFTYEDIMDMVSTF